MEFTNLAVEVETADTKEEVGETPLEENPVPPSSFECRTENENVETEKQNELKAPIRGKFKNFGSRTCIIVLLVVLIVSMISTVITIMAVYIPCSRKAEALVDRGRCDEYIQIEKGNLINLKGTQHGDTAEIECEAGYKLVGAKVITCGSTNDWSEVPKCLLKACQPFDVPLNAVVKPLLNLTATGESFSVSCKDGFKLQGNETVECLYNETWSPVPTCQVHDCGMPKDSPYATVTNLRGTKINDTFYVMCHDGYMTVGNSVVRCKTDGKWSDFPKCIEMSCGIPKIPDHASITFLDGTLYNSSVVFNCTDGYRLLGGQTAFCDYKGKWTEIPTCQQIPDVDDCISDPCKHGNCTDKINGYSCTCDPGYTGASCDIDINECISQPCMHGFCVDKVNTYSCSCFPGFSGSLCDIDIDDCDSEPCNNGTCVDGVGNFTCFCNPGFSGSECDSDLDECSPSPCVRGTCLNGIHQFTCICEPGFTGVNCDIDINDCSTINCYHGTCSDLPGGYNCTCYPGFSGAQCDKEIDECSSNPCLNGRCIDGLAHYTCACTPGFNGSNCEKNEDECSSSPCLHGTCFDGVGQYNCSCEIGYTGFYCEQDIDYCRFSDCKYGECLDLIGGYNCTCYPGFTGVQCDIEIDECSSSPCEIGRCIDGLARYTCVYNDGNNGSNCEIPSYYGTSFITGFMKNYQSNVGIPTIYVLTLSGEANVRISIPYLSINEQVTTIGGALTRTFPSTVASATSGAIYAKGVFISSNVPIMLFSGNMGHNEYKSSDGSFVLPETSFGKDYIIFGYPTVSGSDKFIVIGTADYTQVTLYFKNLQQENITINRLDVYYREYKDVSGTKISADAPVFVSSGHTCANVPNNTVYACDHIEETMPPLSSLGVAHVLSFMKPRSDFTIGIVSPVSNSASIYDNLGNLIEVLTLNAQVAIFRTFTGSSSISVVSVLPVLVTQYGHGSQGGLGDPSMMVIPDISHFGCVYEFAVPAGFNSSTLMIVMSNTYLSQGLLLNNLPITSAQTLTVSIPSYGKFNVLYVNVTFGNYHLSYTSGNVAKFGAWLYGRSRSEEYAWSLGLTV